VRELVCPSPKNDHYGDDEQAGGAQKTKCNHLLALWRGSLLHWSPLQNFALGNLGPMKTIPCDQSPDVSRADIAALVSEHDDVLEIGPFTLPTCRGPRVRYFDVNNKAELIERAKVDSFPSDKAVAIDFVSPTGDLSIVRSQSFDVVLSSHCIEHQPDLIAHFMQIQRILRPGGHYLLVIPDKRYCFDHFLPESSVADVYEARGRLIHTTASVIEHIALTTHNDPARHWSGDHGAAAVDTNPQRIQDAINIVTAHNGRYVDVHAWHFTPTSFRRLINHLGEIGAIKFQIKAVYATIKGTFEFTAVLESVAD
jgi:SAM-dependent methyltransferase